MPSWNPKRVLHPQVWDTHKGALLNFIDGAHSASVCLIDAVPASAPGAAGRLLALTSSRAEVKLWDLKLWEANSGHSADTSFPAAAAWEGVRNGRMGWLAERVVATMPSEKRASVFDLQTAAVVMTLDDSASGLASRTGAWSEAVWSPDDMLLLWGNALWDPRTRSGAPVHRFEVYSKSDSSGAGGGSFHPRGGVAVLNSEVWDLRTHRLLRSVPAMAGCELRFACGGDVAFATPRGGREEGGASAARRARHPLRAAFRSYHTSDWSEITTFRLGHLVGDLFLEPSDHLVGVVEREAVSTGPDAPPGGWLRLYSVGKAWPKEDDSDVEAEEAESEGDDSEGSSSEEGAMPLGEGPDESEDGSARPRRRGGEGGSEGGEEEEEEEDDDEEEGGSDSSGSSAGGGRHGHHGHGRVRDLLPLLRMLAEQEGGSSGSDDDSEGDGSVLLSLGSDDEDDDDLSMDEDADEEDGSGEAEEEEDEEGDDE